MGAEYYTYAGAFVLQIVLAMILMIATVALISSLSPRKSQSYRKLITDMYVAAKTRFLAKEDNLDLDEEEQNFKAWLKKGIASDPNKDLDNVIEGELKERVSEPTNKVTKTKK